MWKGNSLLLVKMAIVCQTTSAVPVTDLLVVQRHKMLKGDKLFHFGTSAGVVVRLLAEKKIQISAPITESSSHVSDTDVIATLVF